MSRVIIFCGLPASGKTTLAREVSVKMNVVCLYKDALKEPLYTWLKGASLEDSQRIGRAVIEMILKLAEDSIKNGVDILLESPFNHLDNVARFQRWCHEYEIDFRIIVCEIDPEERQRRHENRVRHPSHHDRERLNHYSFHADTFDYSLMPGKKLFLKTNEPVPVLVEKVMQFLK